jgi:hypothetical protein
MGQLERARKVSFWSQPGLNKKSIKWSQFETSWRGGPLPWSWSPIQNGTRFFKIAPECKTEFLDLKIRSGGDGVWPALEFSHAPARDRSAGVASCKHVALHSRQRAFRTSHRATSAEHPLPRPPCPILQKLRFLQFQISAGFIEIYSCI